MRNRIFLRLIRRDTKEVFRKNLIFIVFLIIFLFMENMNLRNTFTDMGYSVKDIGIFDFYVYLFRGMKVYTPEIGGRFEIEMDWLILQIFPVLIVISYLKRDLYQMGYQTLIKSGSRKLWWNEKCLWICEFVLMIYGIIYAFGFINYYGCRNTINKSLWEESYGIIFKNCSHMDFIMMFVISQILNAMFMTLFISLISITVNEIIAIVVCVFINVITLYYTTPYLLGNNTMILRNSICIMGEININHCYITYCILLLLVIVIGNIYIEKCDFRNAETCTKE